MRKIIVIIVVLALSLSAIGITWFSWKWLNQNSSGQPQPNGSEQPPPNSITAKKFWHDVWNAQLNISSNWTIYDKVENIYTYKLPAIDFTNRTFNMNNMIEYTAIKFNTSNTYFHLDGNVITNYSIGNYSTFIERTIYIEANQIQPTYTVSGHEINATEGQFMTRSTWGYELLDWFKLLSYNFTTFNFTQESINDTELKVTISNIPEYYPYPVPWFKVKYYASLINHTQGGGIEMVNLSIESIKVFQNNNLIFDLNDPTNYSVNQMIEKDQYIIIHKDQVREFEIEFYSVKFHEILTEPNVTGRGDEIFTVHFIP